MSLKDALLKAVTLQGLDKSYYIAYSGGLDSQVLLHVFHDLRQATLINIAAIHIHHGLSPYADSWALHCKHFCDENNIEYFEHALILPLARGASVEEVARHERYRILENYIDANAILVTAHHQNDQAETLLIQLMRGAGLKGLAGMAECKTFAKGSHIRPFLHIGRSELAAYATANQLAFCEDESNQNRDFTRNFIRHDIMPLLAERFSNPEKLLDRAAMHYAEAQTLLDEYAGLLLKNVGGSREELLSVSKLRAFSPAQIRLILRAWIAKSHAVLPNQLKLQEIQQSVLTAAPDSMPEVIFGHYVVRRFKDDLYLLLQEKPCQVTQPLTWDFSADLSIAGIGVLSQNWVQGKGLSPQVATVTVRFREGGESVSLRQGMHHRLKHLFQEWNVPTWERDRVPLLFHGSRLIAVVGYFLDREFSANASEFGREIFLVG